MSDDSPSQDSRSKTYATRLVASIGLMALLALAVSAPTPFVTMRPGPTFDTLGEFEGKPMLRFGKDVKTYSTDGSLDFTTVSVSRSEARLSVAEIIDAYAFSNDTLVVPRSVVHPDGATDKQSEERSAAQLALSKDSSRVAALRAAGYNVPGVPQVGSVEPGGPADGILKVGDLLLQVDGKKVSDPEQVVDAVKDREPGDKVTFDISRAGKADSVDIVTGPSPEDKKSPRIAITVGAKYQFPVKIENNVGDSIGGPSAGTMFALAIYDKLTPGSLTAGRKIAGTGSITPSGVVEPIGGVQQKISGAAASGAKIFLVPSANCAAAMAGDDHGLRLVKISTLDDAIGSLRKLAANLNAKVPQCR